MEYALKDLEGGECAKCAAPPAAKDPDQVDILQPFIDRLPAPSRIGDGGRKLPQNLCIPGYVSGFFQWAVTTRFTRCCSKAESCERQS